MLIQPLGLPPEESKNADLVFVVDPISAQMRTGVHEEKINPSGSSLEIEDHVSGERVIIEQQRGKFETQ